jgi:hypothetical protein
MIKEFKIKTLTSIDTTINKLLIYEFTKYL